MTMLSPVEGKLKAPEGISPDPSRPRPPISTGRSKRTYAVSHSWEYRSPVIRALMHVIVITAVVIALFPLLAMLATSLQNPEAGGGVKIWPSDFTVDNYTIAWSRLGFSRMFRNSAILSVSTAAACTAVAAMAAYGLARCRFPGRTVFVSILIGMLAIPPIAIIVPIFVRLSSVGLIDTYPAAVIAQIGMLTPFATFLLYSFMKELPRELFEAASVDGAGFVRQFATIAVPLSRPALATTMLIVGIFSWNDLLIPLLMWPSNQSQTLMVGLATLGPGKTGASDIPLMMAGVGISFIPLLSAYLVARRSLVKGLVEGFGK